MIPGSGRSPGEGIGYPLQYSWASLVAQLVKNPPAMRETWVWSLGWKDPLEKGKATHSSILAWRTIQSRGLQRVRHDWVTFTFFIKHELAIVKSPPGFTFLSVSALFSLLLITKSVKISRKKNSNMLLSFSPHHNIKNSKIVPSSILSGLTSQNTKCQVIVKWQDRILIHSPAHPFGQKRGTEFTTGIKILEAPY